MPRNLTPDAIEDFRQRLIDAAERLFAERGPDAVTIRELCAAVGVSAMTPYRYFDDKDAILAAVRARAFNRHAQALETAFAAARNADDARGAIGEAYIAFAEQNPAAYKLMFDVNQPSADQYPELVQAGQRSRRTMTLALDQRPGAAASPGEIEFIGHLYWSAIHGVLMLHLSGMLAPGLTARGLIAPLMMALDREFANKSQPSEPTSGQP